MEDDITYTDYGRTLNCEHKKRRKVRWLTKKSMQELDPMFYKMRFTQHSISSIQEYAPYIDAEVHSLFKKNNNTHLVLDIRKEGEINLDQLITLMKSIQAFAVKVNEDYRFEELVEQSSIKINLQSPGKAEFVYPIGKSIILAAILIGIVSCGSLQNESQIKDEINLKRELYRNEIQQIQDSLNILEAEFQQ
jgi:succinate dehydrogenase flavin-adding protein (antitoxin of CptAB toxin-antitoxin module)